jgi:hypothetical protein
MSQNGVRFGCGAWDLYLYCRHHRWPNDLGVLNDACQHQFSSLGLNERSGAGALESAHLYCKKLRHSDAVACYCSRGSSSRSILPSCLPFHKDLVSSFENGGACHSAAHAASHRFGRRVGCGGKPTFWHTAPRIQVAAASLRGFIFV